MKTIRHRFVEYIPEVLEEGVLYITLEYHTAVHNCFCGCGNKVVTPFSQKDWRLIFEGTTISIKPSIGNWNLECKSHYYITRNSVRFLPLSDNSMDVKNQRLKKRKKTSNK
jgi:hypothetical protein